MLRQMTETYPHIVAIAMETAGGDAWQGRTSAVRRPSPPAV